MLDSKKSLIKRKALNSLTQQKLKMTLAFTNYKSLCVSKFNFLKTNLPNAKGTVQ